MNVTVHNVKGSNEISKQAPFPYGSWVQYWAGVSGFEIEPDKLYNCPACGKAITREHFDGCHVQKAGIVDQKWYIIPLCDSCNHRTGMFSVDGDLLVPVPSNL